MGKTPAARRPLHAPRTRMPRSLEPSGFIYESGRSGRTPSRRASGLPSRPPGRRFETGSKFELLFRFGRGSSSSNFEGSPKRVRSPIMLPPEIPLPPEILEVRSVARSKPGRSGRVRRRRPPFLRSASRGDEHRLRRRPRGPRRSTGESPRWRARPRRSPRSRARRALPGRDW